MWRWVGRAALLQRCWEAGNCAGCAGCATRPSAQVTRLGPRPVGYCDDVYGTCWCDSRSKYGRRNHKASYNSRNLGRPLAGGPLLLAEPLHRHGCPAPSTR